MEGGLGEGGWKGLTAAEHGCAGVWLGWGGGGCCGFGWRWVEVDGVVDGREIGMCRSGAKACVES